MLDTDINYADGDIFQANQMVQSFEYWKEYSVL
jgi:hypothetical protein